MKTIKLIIVLMVGILSVSTLAYADQPNQCLVRVNAGESIQTAIDQAAANDCTVWVAEGVYEENLVIGQSNGLRKNLSIVGAGMGKTTIMGNVAIAHQQANTSSSTSGLTELRHMSVEGNQLVGVGVTVQSDTARLVDVKVSNFTQRGILVTGTYAKAEIDHCVIDHINGTGIHASVGVPNGFATVLVLNSTVVNNNIGIQFSTTWPSGFTFEANVINSIIYQNQFGISANNFGQQQYWRPFVEYNDFYGNGTDLSGHVIGDQVTNLNVDPKFVDAGTGDYRLRKTSPMIDAGDPISPRDPNGTRSDIGALPFQGKLLSAEPVAE